jgi:hypothetical protein
VQRAAICDADRAEVCVRRADNAVSTGRAGDEQIAAVHDLYGASVTLCHCNNAIGGEAVNGVGHGQIAAIGDGDGAIAILSSRHNAVVIAAGAHRSVERNWCRHLCLQQQRHLSGGSLLAINTNGAGNATIYNSGLVTGFIVLDADDTFINEKGGVFETKLTSDFGPGNGLFRNEQGGTVLAATNPKAIGRARLCIWSGSRTLA